MSDDERTLRARLAAQQHDLLAALVAGGAHPPGFDENRLRIQAASLIAKRRGLVAKVAPDLVRKLDGRFAALFTEYARGRPKPPGGSRADARAFAAWLAANHPGTAPQAPSARPRGLLSRIRRRT
ncbi:hypothetical protein HNP84_003791 [Thermocatellispora tengchongensis]|uniref:SCO6045-like C-terminal domain-containing protein n=1 Tax=Thermocatellispora tengchongensis TaxID=1073253 RepID=A0A840PDF1_9ACTN|nr:hypothetical protein [Thermocatellispora tengchongensis]MBB5134065.1 hypothetical protein [Thermocatellispora tengchongensis]